MEQIDESNILRNQVDKIEKEVNQLEKEKEVIQSDCMHKGDTFVAFDNTTTMKKYCSVCKKELGYPSQEEQDLFLGKDKFDGNI